MIEKPVFMPLAVFVEAWNGRISAICNSPVPDIATQHAIVTEYNTIVHAHPPQRGDHRKLEETAQAIYKHWFVDFEFPDEQGQAL